MAPVFGKNNEIVGIADVVSRLELVLHELVKLIHVYVHKELTREIPEWQSFIKSGRMKALNYVLQQSCSAFIRKMLSQDD